MPILEKPKINNLPFHLSKLVKGKRGKRNEAEINDTGKKKTIEIELRKMLKKVLKRVLEN